ncbi:uncharacterized protein WCI35_018582, partial [Daubentonia madagascariensis]
TTAGETQTHQTQAVLCIFSLLKASVHQATKSCENGGQVLPSIEGLIPGHSPQRRRRPEGSLRGHLLAEPP